MPINKLIDSIVDRLADRISARVARLLDHYALSLPETKRIPDAQHCVIEAGTRDRAPFTQGRVEVERMSYSKVIGELPPPQHPPAAPRRQSELCKQADFALDAYRYW